MANEEQLAILKRGVRSWNKWRKENLQTEINLQGADFSEANLGGAALGFANLYGANFSGANLRQATFWEAELQGATLQRADLSGASLRHASLWATDLRDANLSGANLSGTNLRETMFTRADLSNTYLDYAELVIADLQDANLTGTHIYEAYIRGTNLDGSNFSQARIAEVNFGGLDLSHVIGLEDVIHNGPSTLGTDTIAKSRGRIPVVFLQGCGLSDWEIEIVKLYDPDLSYEAKNTVLYKIYDLQATQAIQISPLFISYSHTDSKFVDKVGNRLTKKGVRYWRDIHDMKAGRIERQIDRAIRQNPIVLLVLSENSLISDWVEHEVRTARELEKEMGHDVLCPVALDDSWKSSRWPRRIMEQIMEYNILDFSGWEDDRKFEGMFQRLISGLDLFYR